MSKTFKIPAHMIRQIAPGLGSCIASDRITVGGERVGFMYREAPSGKEDSGWCFLSGTESQDYLDDPNHLSIYDVNTIANYDRDVVPLLNAPTGSAFERSGSGRFTPVGPPPGD